MRKINNIFKKIFIMPIYEKKITKLEKQIIELQNQRDWLIGEKSKYKNANKKLRIKIKIMEGKQC